MGRINYGRVVAGAIVAGAFYFVADGIIHGVFLGGDHMAAVTGAGKTVQHDPTAYAYFAAFDLGKGLVAVLVYAAARPRFGPGVKSAVWAGLVAWFAIEVLPSVAAMPFPFYSKSFYLKWIGLEVVPMVAGAILGAWVYREATAPVPAMSK
jgi:hypothetical protein